jgi:hypothetical protein
LGTLIEGAFVVSVVMVLSWLAFWSVCGLGIAARHGERPLPLVAICVAAGPFGIVGWLAWRQWHPPALDLPKARPSVPIGVAVTLIACGVLTFLTIPLLWIRVEATVAELEFSGGDVWPFAACAFGAGVALAASGGALLAGRWWVALLTGYGAGVANTAFAVIALFTTHSLTGLLPGVTSTVGGVSAGIGIYVILVTGMAAAVAAGQSAVRSSVLLTRGVQGAAVPSATPLLDEIDLTSFDRTSTEPELADTGWM